MAVGVTRALSTCFEATMRAPCKLVNGLVLLRLTGKNFLPISTESGVNVSTPADIPTTCCGIFHVITDINTEESSQIMLTCIAVLAGTTGHVGGE